MQTQTSSNARAQFDADAQRAEREERERLRERIKELTAFCPDKVVNGSYGATVDWKDAHAKAKRAANAANSTTMTITLQDCVAQMERFL